MLHSGVVLQLLARHSELEQSETKAQAVLVTILALTQITELKLLLDIGRMGHRFYEFVLTMLIACICLEIFVGIIIIYIGNLHYYQQVHGDRCYGWFGFINCMLCCCRDDEGCCGAPCKRYGTYRNVAEQRQFDHMLRNTRNAGLGNAGTLEGHGEAEPSAFSLSPASTTAPEMGSVMELERADVLLEAARIKSADAEVRIVRATNYICMVEKASRTTSGRSTELGPDLERAKTDLEMATNDKREAEAEKKLAEARQFRAFFVREQFEDQQERSTFRKMSFWQHAATYLLYFILLMNIFITTFGISGGTSSVFFAEAMSNSTRHH